VYDGHLSSEHFDDAHDRCAAMLDWAFGDRLNLACIRQVVSVRVLEFIRPYYNTSTAGTLNEPEAIVHQMYNDALTRWEGAVPAEVPLPDYTYKLSQTESLRRAFMDGISQDQYSAALAAVREADQADEFRVAVHYMTLLQANGSVDYGLLAVDVGLDRQSVEALLFRFVRRISSEPTP